MLKLESVGPIAILKVEPRITDKGEPVPIVLSGKNGTGKSLALAVVVDAAIEARRQAFVEIPEVEAEMYFRLGSRRYIKSGDEHSQAEVIFASDDHTVSFKEVVSHKHFSESPEACVGMRGHFSPMDRFYKNCDVSELAKPAVRRLLFLYFPYFRYEPAAWLNEKGKTDSADEAVYDEHSRLNPIRTKSVQELKRWLLDVLIDRELYDRVTHRGISIDGVFRDDALAILAYQGLSTTIINLVNELVGELFRAKDPTLSSARIGVSTCQSRTISIVGKDADGSERKIVPDIDQLSSGELMILSLACEIIRGCELVEDQIPSSLDKIAGVVLIDEIDLHLHVQFQRSVLPKVLRLFPKVQFLMTTHSPLFLIGLEETGPVDIFELPLGIPVHVEDLELFKEGFKIYLQKEDRFAKQFSKLQQEVAVLRRPMLITEGKTDVPHLKAALETFQSKGEFTNLNVAFFSGEGHPTLKKLCESLPIITPPMPVIFMFDRDVPEIAKSMSGFPCDLKVVAEGIYSFCLPVPDHRSEDDKIEIELYYKDDDLLRGDVSTGKRLFFQHELQKRQDLDGGCETYHVSGRAAPLSGRRIFSGNANRVLDNNECVVGLSKGEFASLISSGSTLSPSIDRSAFRKIFDVINLIVGGLGARPAGQFE